jgi:hypothetical protein
MGSSWSKQTLLQLQLCCGKNLIISERDNMLLGAKVVLNMLDCVENTNSNCFLIMLSQSMPFQYIHDFLGIKLHVP